MKDPDVIIGADVTVGGEVITGGNLHNTHDAKIHVARGGSFTVSQDVLNDGDIKVGDDQIKTLLIECVKTTGNVAEFGTKVLSTFFGIR